MASSSWVGCIASRVGMDMLMVPAPVRDQLGDAGSEGLVTMFADAHRLAMESLDRRIVEVTTSFEHRLAETESKLRLDMASLKFDLLKWSFLFWVGQLAVLTGILSFLLRNVR